MSDNFKITDSDLVLSNRIKAAINKQAYYDSILNPQLVDMARQIAILVVDKLMHSETYASLTGGYLRGEFGLTDAMVAELPELLYKIVTVTTAIDNGRRVNKMVTIQIGIIDNDDIDLENDGSFVTEKGDQISWLKWLLTAGEAPVVSDYSVRFLREAGRSKMAIMIKSDGQSYNVDGYFSGTSTDNWITRVLNSSQEDIKKIIKDMLNAT